MFNLIRAVIEASWSLLLDSSVYMLFGILVAGLLKIFLSPETVARHLGSGRFFSVVKAAILGLPLPLCSCGVLPAAVSLKKQGANKGATTAFLISTPESGVDSIAISYALLDPIMTVIRPVAALITAMAAGFIENIIDWPDPLASNSGTPVNNQLEKDMTSAPDIPANKGKWSRTIDALRYALVDVWGDIALWFFAGLLIAGLIMILIPDELMTRWLDGGFSSMLIMLVIGIPLYICATASTPVAAALILKGVSPGTALVFLLVGPATNITSLSVLIGILGKKGTVRYLLILSSCAVLFGLTVDQLYAMAGISPQAVIGEASELVPYGLKLAGAFLLIFISIRPFSSWLKKMIAPKKAPLTFQSGFPDIGTYKKN
ncbi:MAG: SO_0444 family Cu/Zn efflux transporter [Proteobacteria bacterium]|nr:permease [Desulfocapsa sp.]MBU3944714.1 SO_0444 family Cu/Zn efflux transporter [Pseudomonadota bacterium]MCG2743279.1 SO_0444 family Cu/Zn efflux transporter [Desulfobacteraceae bacterium]MBU4027771.1 SO_0444 family Cu/Zn efflux transporter [Pseudomonadota bacterium]MBU4042756.1 SO_0444 family Cu/Zn efflux transporter [Pseudomonadota bacterium]